MAFKNINCVAANNNKQYCNHFTEFPALAGLRILPKS